MTPMCDSFTVKAAHVLAALRSVRRKGRRACCDRSTEKAGEATREATALAGILRQLAPQLRQRERERAGLIRFEKI